VNDAAASFRAGVQGAGRRGNVDYPRFTITDARVIRLILGVHMIAREELVGVAVLVVIGATLIALAPAKQRAAPALTPQ